MGLRLERFEIFFTLVFTGVGVRVDLVIERGFRVVMRAVSIWRESTCMYFGSYDIIIIITTTLIIRFMQSGSVTCLVLILIHAI